MNITRMQRQGTALGTSPRLQVPENGSMLGLDPARTTCRLLAGAL